MKKLVLCCVVASILISCTGQPSGIDIPIDMSRFYLMKEDGTYPEPWRSYQRQDESDLTMFHQKDRERGCEELWVLSFEPVKVEYDHTDSFQSIKKEVRSIRAKYQFKSEGDEKKYFIHECLLGRMSLNNYLYDAPIKKIYNKCHIEAYQFSGPQIAYTYQECLTREGLIGVKGKCMREPCGGTPYPYKQSFLPKDPFVIKIK